ncbi:MAG: YggS family pyridoxal phosphate-dependent enzyme [Burkholderiaceae bacterium]|jgi:pyridoxal phosphate enzyme (YggS family)|nr:YggS family pyridoxal phosphate-dependent enzyme [Burkholderiaceae bacterium]
MDGDITLQQRYEAVGRRIETACRAAGRPPDQVTLLAVSKTFPAGRVLDLAGCGQRRFGENYLQEALAKISECAIQRPDWRLEWHFIGPIQSNKTRPIAEHFDWVHSVDRERVARRLAEQRPPHLAPLQVCIQVNIGAEDTKSGCEPAQASALAHLIASLPGLRLRGLMAIPRPETDPAAQQAQFALVRELFERLRAEGLALDTLSMGMSDDLEAAVAQGATIVRVGSALFGRRVAGSVETPA